MCAVTGWRKKVIRGWLILLHCSFFLCFTFAVVGFCSRALSSLSLFSLPYRTLRLVFALSVFLSNRCKNNQPTTSLPTKTQTNTKKDSTHFFHPTTCKQPKVCNLKIDFFRLVLHTSAFVQKLVTRRSKWKKREFDDKQAEWGRRRKMKGKHLVEKRHAYRKHYIFNIFHPMAVGFFRIVSFQFMHFASFLSFEKKCAEYRFDARGTDFICSLCIT